MKYRYSVSIGKQCERCGKDDWLAYQGYNRCVCGQRLWMERRKDVTDGVRFKYVQGPELPSNYPGWLNVTKGGEGRAMSEAQKEALAKARAARRVSRTSLDGLVDGSL